MNTSEQAYTKAQTRFVKAYNTLAAARKAVAAAEQELHEAQEELVRHEIKPGLPRYAALESGHEAAYAAEFKSLDQPEWNSI